MSCHGFSLLACTALAGCLSVDSSSITTQGMHADLSVEADGTGQSLASAELTVGGDLSNVYVDLVGGDQLVASEGQVSRAMARHNDVLGRVWYQAVLPADAEGTEFHIALERSAGGVSAPDSVAVLPAGFDVTAPAPGTSHSRGAPLAVTWQPGRADAVTIQVSGFCIVPAAFAVPSWATSYTIGASQLRALDGQPPDGSCDIAIVIVRKRAGGVDPAYGEGGSFEARQVRSVTVVSVP